MILQNLKKSKVKNRCNLAASPKESYSTEGAVLPPLLIVMAVALTKHTHTLNLNNRIQNNRFNWIPYVERMEPEHIPQ
jgi:hypothetical protein